MPKVKYYQIQCEVCGHWNEQPVTKLPEYTNCPECKKHRNYCYFVLFTENEGETKN